MTTSVRSLSDKTRKDEIKGLLYEIIAKHSGQEYQKVHDVSDRDYWMIASEAKAFGIIDEVLTGDSVAN